MPRFIEPNYERDIERLVSVYRQGAKDILHELLTLDLDKLNDRRRRALLASVLGRLDEIDKEASAWVKENIPKAYQNGQSTAVVALGEASTVSIAADMISTASINKHFVDAMISDTYEDLLRNTNHMRARIKSAVRNVVGEQLRAKIAANEARKSMTAGVIKNLRRELEAAGSFGIVDRAGRRWRVEDYSNMVVRTKLMQAHIEGVRNESIERGVSLGIISSHGAKDGCARFEGKLVKLDPNAPGNYPTIEELRATKLIWHPNCKHVVFPVRDPELLPPNLREKAKEPVKL